ncbi:hypothetical protein ARMSODRAFT_351862 [Armillaria solidipes]|uniref:Uncharacterized protein n=1 Tax=Armillaria solidipes TaxID=1076256 RepID=A0A2H3B6W4_9AGAR|nr:hypothetical protein ARMSODRAFT_351862 [Armillaria solidipes]
MYPVSGSSYYSSRISSCWQELGTLESFSVQKLRISRALAKQLHLAPSDRLKSSAFHMISQGSPKIEEGPTYAMQGERSPWITYVRRRVQIVIVLIIGEYGVTQQNARTSKRNELPRFTTGRMSALPVNPCSSRPVVIAKSFHWSAVHLCQNLASTVVFLKTGNLSRSGSLWRNAFGRLSKNGDS